MIDYMDKKIKEEKYGDEMVYIVPFNLAKSLGDNFTPNFINKDFYNSVELLGRYVYRSDAEGDFSMQQIIPYVLVKRESDNKYFVTKRLSGEERLEGTLSIGIGGHIDIEDGYGNMIINGLEREVDEEVFIKKKKSLKFLGYMRDMSSSTNDHIGFIFLLNVKDCKIKETDKLKGYWLNYDELEEKYPKFEGWGRYMIDYMFLNQKEKSFDDDKKYKIVKEY